MKLAGLTVVLALIVVAPIFIIIVTLPVCLVLLRMMFQLERDLRRIRRRREALEQRQVAP